MRTPSSSMSKRMCLHRENDRSERPVFSKEKYTEWRFRYPRDIMSPSLVPKVKRGPSQGAQQVLSDVQQVTEYHPSGGVLLHFMGVERSTASSKEAQLHLKKRSCSRSVILHFCYYLLLCTGSSGGESYLSCCTHSEGSAGQPKAGRSFLLASIASSDSEGTSVSYRVIISLLTQSAAAYQHWLPPLLSDDGR